MRPPRPVLAVKTAAMAGFSDFHMTETKKLPKIFCAIDTADMDHAMALSAAMQRAECGIKLGLQFFNAAGPDGIRQIRDAYPDLSLFIDLKYHDIPNTVAQAVRAIAPLEPDFLNVHATGGLAMMRAARDALREEAGKAGIEAPQLLGVTILTSLDDQALEESGFKAGLNERVQELALLTQKAGLDGVVCSPLEIELVREACGPEFTLMVPGIRPAAETRNDDQKRVMTPQEAAKKGADHLVIGRPITERKNPAEAAAAIVKAMTP